MTDINTTEEWLLEKRKIFLSGEINTQTVTPVIQDLLYFNESKKDVFLYICSPGGYVDAGMALLDAMNLMQYDINTIVTGEASSMAAIIAICGTKGKRYMFKNASLMLHQVSSDELEGTPAEIKNYLKEFEKSGKTLNKIISRQTNKSVKQIRKDIENLDFWMSVKAAIKYKAIDKVWTKTLETKSNKVKVNAKQEKRI